MYFYNDCVCISFSGENVESFSFALSSPHLLCFYGGEMYNHLLFVCKGLNIVRKVILGVLRSYWHTPTILILS